MAMSNNDSDTDIFSLDQTDENLRQLNAIESFDEIYKTYTEISVGSKSRNSSTSTLRSLGEPNTENYEDEINQIADELNSKSTIASTSTTSIASLNLSTNTIEYTETDKDKNPISVSLASKPPSPPADLMDHIRVQYEQYRIASGQGTKIDNQACCAYNVETTQGCSNMADDKQSKQTEKYANTSKNQDGMNVADYYTQMNYNMGMDMGMGMGLGMGMDMNMANGFNYPNFVPQQAMPGAPLQYPLPGSMQPYPLPASMQPYPMPGSMQSYPMPGSIQTYSLPASMQPYPMQQCQLSDMNYFNFMQQSTQPGMPGLNNYVQFQGQAQQQQQQQQSRSQASQTMQPSLAGGYSQMEETPPNESATTLDSTSCNSIHNSSAEADVGGQQEPTASKTYYSNSSSNVSLEANLSGGKDSDQTADSDQAMDLSADNQDGGFQMPITTPVSQCQVGHCLVNGYRNGGNLPAMAFGRNEQQQNGLPTALFGGYSAPMPPPPPCMPTSSCPPMRCCSPQPELCACSGNCLDMEGFIQKVHAAQRQCMNATLPPCQGMGMSMSSSSQSSPFAACGQCDAPAPCTPCPQCNPCDQCSPCSPFDLAGCCQPMKPRCCVNDSLQSKSVYTTDYQPHCIGGNNFNHFPKSNNFGPFDSGNPNANNCQRCDLNGCLPPLCPSYPCAFACPGGCMLPPCDYAAMCPCSVPACSMNCSIPCSMPCPMSCPVPCSMPCSAANACSPSCPVPCSQSSQATGCSPCN